MGPLDKDLNSMFLAAVAPMIAVFIAYVMQSWKLDVIHTLLDSKMKASLDKIEALKTEVKELRAEAAIRNDGVDRHRPMAKF